ncbi:hypothetical protein GHT06_010983 [Daphnia sinensis]|uniref:Uncharacterized protein n=1 Tax=Daphnia sinensis TaxID=1820382 RepID=A0AAD5Q1P9_9CRUS|nr:hypothetical protein GHT06_010983 [Daphnia sinensis]
MAAYALHVLPAQKPHWKAKCRGVYADQLQPTRNEIFGQRQNSVSVKENIVPYARGALKRNVTSTMLWGTLVISFFFFRQKQKVDTSEDLYRQNSNGTLNRQLRRIFHRAYRFVRELPKKKGSKKDSNYRSLPNLSTAEETAPQSIDVNHVEPSLEQVAVENDLIAFDDTQPTALHIPFPGTSRRRASRAKSVSASSVVSGAASSLNIIPEILSRDSLDVDVENQEEEKEPFQSTTSLGGCRTMTPFQHTSTLVSKAQSVPELSTRMQNSNDRDMHYTKTLLHRPQANVSTGGVANCDSAYVSASNFELNDTNSLSSSSESSETGSTSSSSSGEQESDEDAQEEHTNRVAKYKKHSLSSTAPLVPPKKSTKKSDKQKKENAHLQKEVAELVLKAIGKYTSDMGYLAEIVIGLQLNNIEQFGPQFTGDVKITSLHKAIKHVFKRRGTRHDPDIADRITAECIKIRDALNPNDSDAEYVTGIQKEILRWFLDRMKTYKHKISAKLENHLNKFPWLCDDGRVSLKNVRTCIQLVHKDLRSTLAFLAQTIDWNNVESFSSPRPKENKKGNACGHGWYFLIHHSLASHCKAVDASKADQEMLMPFPPSGEIELDAGGRIQIGTLAIQIEIGEIKTSAKGVQKGQIQLKRSLLVSASLCRYIHAEANVPYILKGYIFVAGKKKKGDQRVFPKEQVFSPPGTLHYQVIYPSKYKPSPPNEQSTDSSC